MPFPPLPGRAGAAEATVISQYVSGIGIAGYTLKKFPDLFGRDERVRLRLGRMWEIFRFSALTCAQQSIMNFGILAVQGLVNSFGTTVMAAFAAAVKIDAFAYLPVQDFGNAFSIFIAQNYGAREEARIRRGLRGAMLASAGFGLAVSLMVAVFAAPLMALFVDAGERAVIAAGVGYLRIEGAFYPLIGILFLLYGLYRALGRPGMSMVLTVVSLGTRVLLAYRLSAVPALGVTGIWWSVPIGLVAGRSSGHGILSSQAADPASWRADPMIGRGAPSFRARNAEARAFTGQPLPQALHGGDMLQNEPGRRPDPGLPPVDTAEAPSPQKSAASLRPPYHTRAYTAIIMTIPTRMLMELICAAFAPSPPAFTVRSGAALATGAIRRTQTA